jgi:hypothetical protein
MLVIGVELGPEHSVGKRRHYSALQSESFCAADVALVKYSQLPKRRLARGSGGSTAVPADREPLAPEPYV